MQGLNIPFPHMTSTAWNPFPAESYRIPESQDPNENGLQHKQNCSPMDKHTAGCFHAYLEGCNLFSKFTFPISASYKRLHIYFDFKTFQLNRSPLQHNTKGWRKLWEGFQYPCVVLFEEFVLEWLDLLCLCVDGATEHGADLLKSGRSEALLK